MNPSQWGASATIHRPAEPIAAGPEDLGDSAGDYTAEGMRKGYRKTALYIHIFVTIRRVRHFYIISNKIALSDVFRLSGENHVKTTACEIPRDGSARSCWAFSVAFRPPSFRPIFRRSVPGCSDERPATALGNPAQRGRGQSSEHCARPRRPRAPAGPVPCRTVADSA